MGGHDDGKEIHVDIDLSDIEEGRLDSLFTKLGLSDPEPDLYAEEKPMPNSVKARVATFLRLISSMVHPVQSDGEMKISTYVYESSPDGVVVRVEARRLESIDIEAVKRGTDLSDSLDIYPLVNGRTRVEWGFSPRLMIDPSKIDFGGI